MSESLLQEIRERRVTASQEWDTLVDEAKKDRLCVAGNPWEAIDPEGLKQRKDAKRPYLALDELGQYINQTVNDVRANPRGIKFAPTGNGANDQGAEFYQNHTREIEYRSHARVAYATAFESAVTSSFGWLRVRTKREHVRTFNQDLWIEPIVNPDQVLPDPNAVWPDSRDMKYLYFIEPWTKGDFTRTFPKAKFKSFSSELRAIAAQWVQKDLIHVAEYWRLVTLSRRLVAFQRPGVDPKTRQPWPVQVSLVDELPNGKLPRGVDNLREEDVEDTKVESYLTNGLEILRENKWKGKHIPFVSCFGKVIYVDGKRQMLSMTRLARDPYMLYCYYRTCEAELVGMTPKFPYFVYEGQLSPTQLLNLQKSLHEPVAVIQVKPTVEGAPANTVLAFPTRQPYEPPMQGLELGAEAARRAIQAAMGISPLPTEAQRQNQKSGVALRQIESSGQRGSFHFVDHYELMIERTGVIIEDLIDKIIDTKRDVPVRSQDDSADVVTVNDPANPQSVHTKGDYRVTISTGPATDSQREAADGFVDTMVTNLAVVAQLAGPQKAAQLLAKSVKLKQLGPIGDEIVDLLTPPEMNGKDGKPLPPEVQQLLQHVQALQAQLQQAAQTIESDVHKEKAKIEGQKELKAMELEFNRLKLDVESETKLAVAALSAKVERLTLLLESQARLAEHIHASGEAARDRAHEVGMAAAATAGADRERREGFAHDDLAGERAHEQTLEQQEMSAAASEATA